MNIFSGARRIGAILAALWIVGIIAFHISKDIVVRVEYRVPSFAALWFISDKCDIGTDAIAYRAFTTPDGAEVSARFCFAAHKTTNGSLMVPYAEEGNFILLNGPYSDEVKAYTEDFVEKTFSPAAADFEVADQKYGNQKWYERGYSAGVLFGGLIFLWACMWCIGWVMRGFLGIPRGQDYRIAPVVMQK